VPGMRVWSDIQGFLLVKGHDAPLPPVRTSGEQLEKHSKVHFLQRRGNGEREQPG
jgi:hypothetical protein